MKKVFWCSTGYNASISVERQEEYIVFTSHLGTKCNLSLCLVEGLAKLLEGEGKIFLQLYNMKFTSLPNNMISFEIGIDGILLNKTNKEMLSAYLKEISNVNV